MSTNKETKKILKNLGVKHKLIDDMHSKKVVMNDLRKYSKTQLRELVESRSDRKKIENWIKENKKKSRRNRDDKKDKERTKKKEKEKTKKDKEKAEKTKTMTKDQREKTKTKKEKEKTKTKTKAKKEKEKTRTKKDKERSEKDKKRGKDRAEKGKKSSKRKKREKEGDEKKEKRKPRRKKDFGDPSSYKMTSEEAKELSELIKKEEGLIMTSRFHYGKEYYNCFLITDLIEEISNLKKVRKKEAICMAQKLLDHGYIGGFYGQTKVEEKRAYYALKDPSEVIKKLVVPSSERKLEKSKDKKPAPEKSKEEKPPTKQEPRKKEPITPPKSIKSKEKEEKDVKEEEIEKLRRQIKEQEEQAKKLEMKLKKQEIVFEREKTLEKRNQEELTPKVESDSEEKKKTKEKVAIKTEPIKSESKSEEDEESYEDYYYYSYEESYSEDEDTSSSELTESSEKYSKLAGKKEEKPKPLETTSSSSKVNRLVQRYESIQKERCGNCFMEKPIDELEDVRGRLICNSCYDNYVELLSSEEETENKTEKEKIIERIRKQGGRDFGMDKINEEEIRCSRCGESFPYSLMANMSGMNYCNDCLEIIKKRNRRLRRNR